MVAAVLPMEIPAANRILADHDPADTADRELVERSQQGELRAYDDLVRRYQERIYARFIT